MFESLTIGSWRQYKSVDISFDKRLTVLTGANGSGKTTILNILAQHFDWVSHIASTPRKKKDGSTEYSSDYHPWGDMDEEQLPYNMQDNPSVGRITYFGTDDSCLFGTSIL